MHNSLSVTLPEGQMKTAEIHDLAEAESVRLRVSSYQITPLSRYTSTEPGVDLWASGDIAVMAAGDGLQLISLKDPANPELALHLPEHKVTRLGGSQTHLYGLSAQGLEIFSYTPDFKHLSSTPLDGALDLAAGEQTLVYVLTGKALLVFDTADGSQATLLYEHPLDLPHSRLVAIRSALYLSGENQLTAYSLARPWLPESMSTVALPGIASLSHWGASVAVQGPAGTQLYQPGPDGELVQIADYPMGHWGTGFVADRHHRYSLSTLTDGGGFTLWRAYHRRARAGMDGV